MLALLSFRWSNLAPLLVFHDTWTLNGRCSSQMTHPVVAVTEEQATAVMAGLDPDIETDVVVCILHPSMRLDQQER